MPNKDNELGYTLTCLALLEKANAYPHCRCQHCADEWATRAGMIAVVQDYIERHYGLAADTPRAKTEMPPIDWKGLVMAASGYAALPLTTEMPPRPIDQLATPPMPTEAEAEALAQEYAAEGEDIPF